MYTQFTPSKSYGIPKGSLYVVGQLTRNNCQNLVHGTPLPSKIKIKTV